MLKFRIKYINPRLRWFYEWQCKKFGCIISGLYYDMIQSHCRRCGKKISYAADFCKDEKPWGEYE